MRASCLLAKRPCGLVRNLGLTALRSRDARTINGRPAVWLSNIRDTAPRERRCLVSQRANPLTGRALRHPEMRGRPSECSETMGALAHPRSEPSS